MPTPRADPTCPQLLLTRREARRAGFSDVRINALLRARRWHSPVRGVLATVPGPLALDQACRAAILSQQRPAVVSHHTAAGLLGLPRLRALDRVDLTLPPPATTVQPRALRLHWPYLDPVDVHDHEGIPVTGAARVVADIAREPTMHRGAVILGDAAVSLGLCTQQDIMDAVSRLAHPAHRVLAGRVAARIDGRSLSPQETRARLILIDGGLPAPEVNWPLLDDDGRLVAIGDLVYDEYLLWMEYDGYLVHSERETFRNDRLRERRIRGYGFEVVRLVDEDVANPAGLVRLTESYLRDAPRRIAALPAGMSRYVDLDQRRLRLAG